MTKRAFELAAGERLKIRKRGNFFFAYGRKTRDEGQRERFLGRCSPKGIPFPPVLFYTRRNVE